MDGYIKIYARGLINTPHSTDVKEVMINKSMIVDINIEPIKYYGKGICIFIKTLNSNTMYRVLKDKSGHEFKSYQDAYDHIEHLMAENKEEGNL